MHISSYGYEKSSIEQYDTFSKAHILKVEMN